MLMLQSEDKTLSSKDTISFSPHSADGMLPIGSEVLRALLRRNCHYKELLSWLGLPCHPSSLAAVFPKDITAVALFLKSTTV